MNKYERSLMFNVKLMKIFYVVILFVNLLIPLRRGVLFYFAPLQLVISIVWLLGLLGGMGYFDQRTPVIPVGLVRFVELLYYGMLHKEFLNWIAFAIFCGLDALYVALLFFDKANYEYVKEVESDE